MSVSKSVPMKPSTPFDQRRACLALAALPLLAAPHSVFAQAFIDHVRQNHLEAMKLSSDGVVMDFPRLADTGSAVPLQVQINAPAGLKIAQIEIFLPENPNTRALKLRLPEPQASYNFSTRLRLAGTQEAWVVATMTDGSKRGASKPTIITSSACFDGS
jgi:predicted secreted protein